MAKQRGRKSTAKLATAAPVATIRPGRPAPPRELSERAASVWRAAVSSMPADWITPEQHPQMVAYCRHVERSERFEALLTDADELLELDRLAKMVERENRAALALARSLRLTKQAQARPEHAQRDRGGPAIDFSEVKRK